MPLRLGIAHEHTAWDGTQAVTLESVRAGRGPRLDHVGTAKRRNIRGAEKSPSQGTYVGYEVNWHLPTVLLSPGLTPKPGDAILEEDGRRWTVLTVAANRQGYTYACGCVDLVLANDLREAIDIERPTVEYDAGGFARKRYPSGTEPDLGGSYVARNLAASVQLTQAAREDQRGVRGFLGTYDVVLGAPVEVTMEDRVKWTDEKGNVRYFDIRSIRNPTRIDELMVLECEARP